MQKKYLEAGKIVGTHGIKGELRVQPWCDSAEFLTRFSTLYLEAGNVPVHVLSSRVHKELLLMVLEGVDSVEKADTYRNKVLYLDRSDVTLPDGRYFMQDLVGLDVYDADTFLYYGTLTRVLRTGANDVYQITAQDHKNYLIPAVPEFILGIDLEKGKMMIRPIRGIFDDED
ncbi:Ribosome maturation factor RimM [Caprobacter fermentans]|uniref:Ribosome maturation factor RimM n=1 Tax=Caproicibacter fermentans TaxID=2576756 RepID=A0A6N8HXL6_9FIRM|nr:ribosome maturation factor RimM [Caproicibacter fermentans]MVB10594.1 Ribosome maturation factor RimM [Caproicibacter fermentans]OCN00684.1 16S rRNA processing protein RimM [Clostridium sp. W14A]QNK41621.1 16S rRNA processing protein RimM [Caproicibacter fermentans]